MALAQQCVQVSAPGKVLITGGYLVLDQQHPGLVLATTARFHTKIEGSSGSATQPTDGFELKVYSPQFEQTISGRIISDANGVFAYALSSDSSRNAYIEETVLCAINGVVGLEPEVVRSTFQHLAQSHNGVKVTLQADNDFYSQVTRLQEANKPFNRHELAQLPAFLPPTMEETASGDTVAMKTGMGSSAALVTSLVAAIVRFFIPRSELEADEVELQLIHNLAQLSHCFVQRKIGSGFDVSAACYGSHRYNRFPASILDKFTSEEGLKPVEIAACLRNEGDWTISQRVKRFQLPSGFQLLMGDVSAGSSTVSMVRQVLNWQKSKPEEASRVISFLHAHNAEVEDALMKLDKLFSTSDSAKLEKLHAVRKQLASSKSEQWQQVDAELGVILKNAREAFLSVRRYLREMGSLAGVPIEPAEQSELVDATMEIPGVLFAGVPGAGGFDAVFVLALDDSVLPQVEKLWLSWPETHASSTVCPLLCGIASTSTFSGLQFHRS